MHSSHRVRVSLSASLVTRRRIAIVKRCRSVDKSALTVSLDGRAAGLLNELRSFSQLFHARSVPELTVKTHRLAPVRHGAGWVVLADLLELEPRVFVAEGV